MNIFFGKSKLLIGTALFLLMTSLHAIPVWTFTPLTPTTISVPANGTATISYKVTNQSKITHSLLMTPITGITASGNCSSPIVYHDSCILNLLIRGGALEGNVVGGPILCQDGDPLQCYRPSPNDILNITKGVNRYTVTPITDGNGSISPSTPQTVNTGSNLTFTATPNVDFRVYEWILDGIIVQNGNTTYTLSNITANHTVEATFTSIYATIEVMPTTLDIEAGGFSGSVSVTNLSPLLTANFSAPVIADLSVATLSPSSTCTGTLAPESSCTYVFTSTGLAGTTTTATINTNTMTTRPTSITTTILITANPPVVLSQSLNRLALSVKNTALNNALTGNPRHITITNTDPTFTAFNVAYDSTALPFGTTITPATCGNILAGGTCVITIHPGANPSATAYNLNPTPITLNIEGENTNALTLPVNILSYGSVYESGFVFAINDSYAAYPIGVSVGGKVASLNNLALPAGVVWDTTPQCTSLQRNCTNTNATSGINGIDNTIKIYNTLNSSSPPTPSYAARVCVDFADGGFNDWFLPAICEMGKTDPGGIEAPICVNSPTQNIRSNLPGLLTPTCTGLKCLIGPTPTTTTTLYWSSTQYPPSSTGKVNAAYTQNFYNKGSQSPVSKGTVAGGGGLNMFPIRCARPLTP
jgi:hypothetical protein